jgi:hypothetical protein
MNVAATIPVDQWDALFARVDNVRRISQTFGCGEDEDRDVLLVEYGAHD